MSIDEVTHKFNNLTVPDAEEFNNKITSKVTGAPTHQFSLPHVIDPKCLATGKKTNHCFIALQQSLYIASPITLVDELHKNPFFRPGIVHSFPEGDSCVVGFTNASTKFDIDLQSKSIVRGFDTCKDPFAIPSAMAASNRTLYCGHENGILTVHDRSIKEPIFSIPSPESIKVNQCKRIRKTVEHPLPELHLKHPLPEFVDPVAENTQVFTHKKYRSITALNLSNNENHVAAAFSNGAVKLWDVRKGFENTLFSITITRKKPIKAIAWDPEKPNRFFVGTQETPSRFIMYDTSGSSLRSTRQNFAEYPIENICFLNNCAAITSMVKGPAPVWHIQKETTSLQARIGNNGMTPLSSHFLQESLTAVTLALKGENECSIASWNLSETKARNKTAKNAPRKSTNTTKKVETRTLRRQ